MITSSTQSSLLRALAALTLLTTLPALGCSGCKKKPPAPKLEDDEPVVEAPVEPEVTEADAVFDAVLKGCELSNANRIKNCQNGEYEIFKDYVRSQGVDIISPMTELMLSSKVSKKRLGTQILRDYIPTIIHTADPELIAEGDVRALLAFVQEQDPTMSPYALSVAAPVMGLAAKKGMDDEVRGTLKKLDPTANKATMWLHLAALKGYVSQARLGAFDLVENAASDERAEMQIGALEAVMEIPNWTDEEEQKICAWNQGFLTSENSDELKGTPAELILRCDRDTWHTKLIEEAERREKAMTYGRPFADNFRFLCPKNIGIDERKDPLCVRQYELFHRVAKNTKYSDKERRYAISLMADRWIDDQTLEDVGKFKDDRSEEVAELATRMHDFIEKRKKGIDEAKARKEAGIESPKYGPGEGG